MSANRKIAKEYARNLLRSKGISFKADYDTLHISDVDRLLEVADLMRYRKPKNANGSRGRYFFAYLQSARGE